MVTTIPVSSESMTARLARRVGLPGLVALTWALAGGILLGGAWVAGLAASGRASGNLLFSLTTVLFAGGAILGFVHGSLLGYLGRGSGTSGWEALRSLVKGGLLAVPASAVGWGLALWVGLAGAASAVDEVVILLSMALGWILGGAICVWAVAETVAALRNALSRWGHRWIGSTLLLSTFVALTTAFLLERPEIWGTDLRVSAVGAVMLAMGATIWLAGPVVVALVHFIPDHAPVGWSRRPRVAGARGEEAGAESGNRSHGA